MKRCTAEPTGLPGRAVRNLARRNVFLPPLAPRDANAPPSRVTSWPGSPASDPYRDPGTLFGRKSGPSRTPLGRRSFRIRGGRRAQTRRPRSQPRKVWPPSVRKPLASFAAALLAFALTASAARADVFISELCDPLNNFSTDRYIEIYNSGPGPVSLSGWSLIAIANSANAMTWPLSGTIAAGQAKVAGYTAPVTAFTPDFTNAAWNTNISGQGSFNWNGQVGDGAKLVNGSGLTVDSLIATGVLFKDGSLVRIASVGTGNLGLLPAQWTFTAVTLATDATPGSHNGSAPPPAGPTITNVVTDPAVPGAGTPTDVLADVTDPNVINAVTLSWGTSAASLANSIGMVLQGGNTYRTSAQIPGQPGGATIYYRVQAENDSATSQSSILSYTIAGGGGGVPPSVLAVGEMSDSTLLVFFSEPVEETSAETASNYVIGTNVAVNAVRDPAHTEQVLITMRNLTAGTKTLTVNGVSDLTGDIAFGATRLFNYVDVTIPPGYYASAIGLTGSALQIALHNIIKNHTSISYSALLSAFQTTDVKPNGKVWDMYSDVPGGTPPYEYSFGQTGQGATEGLGYNREHSFPQSWFNGNSPMYSDLFHLYPTDSKVNGYRGNFAYGVVASPTTTSLNGSKVGPSATPGFTGTVFEPIDAYKGDLVRGVLYMSTRYLFEDSSWPGGDPCDGAQFYPWAVAQYLDWSVNDPVSWKERMRNGAVYAIQHNRNPFVDHPEFLAAIWDSNATVGVAPGAPVAALQLGANAPNPFTTLMRIGFELPRRERASLRVFDVAGREVRTLVAAGELDAGRHDATWDGRDASGARVPAGLYFCRLEAGPETRTRRVVYAR